MVYQYLPMRLTVKGIRKIGNIIVGTAIIPNTMKKGHKMGEQQHNHSFLFIMSQHSAIPQNIPNTIDRAKNIAIIAKPIESSIGNIIMRKNAKILGHPVD